MSYRLFLLITTLLFNNNNIFAQKVFMAVHDFEGKGVSAVEASALTDRLRTEIIKLGQVNIVERAEMEEILREQGYQQSGCFTSECMVEVGKLIGAEKIISGSISLVGNTYSVNGRVINVETGEIENSITYDLSGEIDELLISGMRNVAQLLFTESNEDYIELNTTYVYYDNGQIKSEGQLIGDIKVGRWTYYYDTGRFEKIGSFRNNKEIGKWTYFYPEGLKKKQGSYTDSIKDGDWIYFYPSGLKEKEGNYIGGIKNGDWVYYHPNGQISQECSFFMGVKDKRWIEYSADGRILSEQEYNKGNPNGEWFFYFASDSSFSKIKFSKGNLIKWSITRGKVSYPVNLENLTEFDYKNVEMFLGGPFDDVITIRLKRNPPQLKLFKSSKFLNKIFKNRNGLLLEYYPNGKMLSKVTTYNNFADGIRIVYDKESGDEITFYTFKKGSGYYYGYGRSKYILAKGHCNDYNGITMTKTGKWFFTRLNNEIEIIDYGRGEKN